MSALSKYLGYIFAINVQKPFTEWDAYKFGLIDDKGEVIRKPITREEKESFEGIMNVIRKIKKILVKYIGDKRVIQFLIAAYLLKESEGDEYQEFRSSVESELTESELIKFEKCMSSISSMHLNR